MTDIKTLAEKVKEARHYLTDWKGWNRISEVGDLADPSGVVWFSTGYAYGEYTLTTSLRKNGAGTALRELRVRLTDSRLEANPELIEHLVTGLAVTCEGPRDDDEFPIEWPPKGWGDVAV